MRQRLSCCGARFAADEAVQPAQLSFVRGNVHGHQRCCLRCGDHRRDRGGYVVLRCRANRDSYNNKLSHICCDDVRNAVADRSLEFYQRGTAEFRSQGRSSAARVQSGHPRCHSAGPVRAWRCYRACGSPCPPLSVHPGGKPNLPATMSVTPLRPKASQTASLGAPPNVDFRRCMYGSDGHLKR